MKHSGWMLSIRDTRSDYRHNYGKRLSAEDARTLAHFINSFLAYHNAETIPYDPLFQDAIPEHSFPSLYGQHRPGISWVFVGWMKAAPESARVVPMLPAEQTRSNEAINLTYGDHHGMEVPRVIFTGTSVFPSMQEGRGGNGEC